MNMRPNIALRRTFLVAAAMTCLVLTACASDNTYNPAAYGGGVAHTGSQFSGTGVPISASLIAEVDLPSGARTRDVRNFYKEQGNFSTFYRNGRWTWAGAQAFNTLRNAANDGLAPEAYLPNNMLQSRTLMPFEPQTTDVLLTAGLMAYMADVHQGANNPRRKTIGAKLLREGVERSDFNVYLASLAPKGRSYSALKSVLNGR